MKDKLRIVLAGCGSMSRHWLKTVGDRDDAEIVGLVDVMEEAAAQKKDEFELASAITSTSLETALEQTRPDVVFDCSIPDAHYSVTMKALSCGCHVLGEKPLADSMEHAVEMVRASRAAGKIYAVIQNRRYDLRIRGFRQFLDSGQIGALTTLNSDFYIGAHFGGFRDHMKHVLLLDMAIHTFDQARYISNSDPVAVYCHEWNPRGSWYDHDASAVAIFEMSDGIIYTYRGSWCGEGLSTTWECDWRAIGQTGSAFWNGADEFKAQGVKEPGGLKVEVSDLPIGPASSGLSGGHAGLINNFLDCVRTGEIPETICTDNIKSLAMVFGAIESAETKQRVEITLPKFD